MYVNDSGFAVRQYEAQPPFWGSKVASITTPAWQKYPGRSYLVMVVGVLAFSGAMSGLYLGVQALTKNGEEWMQALAGYGFQFGALVALMGGVYGWYWWSRGRKIVIAVSGDSLTVTTRPGDVYAFQGAQLGTWGVTGGASMGTALHLHSGDRRFILGGRDRRVSIHTRLDAPDAGYGQSLDVDAWLPAAEFDEILRMVAAGSGLDIRSPGPGEPVRCLLFVNPLKLQELGSFSYRKQREFVKSMQQPRLAIELGDRSIRVLDATSNALVAAVSQAQVTAAPVVFAPVSRHLLPNLGHAMSDAATNHWSTAVGMRVTLPGMEPLTIGCRDTNTGLDQRFSWPDDVPREHARADYEVSGTDWLALVQALGVSRQG